MNTWGPYIVKQTLGRGGYATVKLAEHSETGKEVALKMMKRNDDQSVKGSYENEVTIMRDLAHTGLIQMFDFSDSAEYILANGSKMNVYYIALEYAQYGELFELIANTGKFSELFARYYFHQLIDGIEYMHENGIVHRDIKPENILLDENFNLKLTDFGFATYDEITTSRKGTISYMAPEMFYSGEFRTKPTDIFSAAIILFIMVKGAPPFEEAKANNPHYKIFWGNPSIFWKIHTKRDKTLFSVELMELLTTLFDYDSERRITIKQIKENAWYNGPLPTEEQLSEEIAIRKHKLEQVSEDSQ